MEGFRVRERVKVNGVDGRVTSDEWGAVKTVGEWLSAGNDHEKSRKSTKPGIACAPLPLFRVFL
jgi:hypothetical protein